MRKITAILILVGLVVLPMIAAADSTATDSVATDNMPFHRAGCETITQLNLYGTVPDVAVTNVCSHAP